MTQAMFQVLVVEDDEALGRVLSTLLEAHGHRCVLAGSARRALVEARSHKPDLALVDLGLPDGDGLAVIRAIREYSSMPVLVLSARIAEAEKVRALDAGADDYVTKPFSTPELLARIRAALRRRVRSDESLPVLHLGDVAIDFGARTASRGTEPVHLTPLEFRLLECLARRAGLIVMQRELIAEVWGPDRVDDSRSLRSCMKNLRQKLEPDPARPRFLLTELGLGYRLCP